MWCYYQLVITISSLGIECYQCRPKSEIVQPLERLRFFRTLVQPQAPFSLKVMLVRLTKASRKKERETKSETICSQKRIQKPNRLKLTVVLGCKIWSCRGLLTILLNILTLQDPIQVQLLTTWFPSWPSDEHLSRLVVFHDRHPACKSEKQIFAELPFWTPFWDT